MNPTLDHLAGIFIFSFHTLSLLDRERGIVLVLDVQAAWFHIPARPIIWRWYLDAADGIGVTDRVAIWVVEVMRLSPGWARI